jgi:hypothetical protein
VEPLSRHVRRDHLFDLRVEAEALCMSIILKPRKEAGRCCFGDGVCKHDYILVGVSKRSSSQVREYSKSKSCPQCVIQRPCHSMHVSMSTYVYKVIKSVIPLSGKRYFLTPVLSVLLNSLSVVVLLEPNTKQKVRIRFLRG